MNYLSHIYLSGDDRQVQLGNFIGDAVKGRSYTSLPDRIAEGVLLHRRIDHFTDNHPITRELKHQLRPHFGRYSGILLDIYFDYFLASRFMEYSKIPLKKFSRDFYMTMISNRKHLPTRIKGFMWHFIGTNRLGKYASAEGIRESLEIMVRYHKIDISVKQAIDYLCENEKRLYAAFHQFFAELNTYCSVNTEGVGKSGTSR